MLARRTTNQTRHTDNRGSRQVDVTPPKKATSYHTPSVHPGTTPLSRPKSVGDVINSAHQEQLPISRVHSILQRVSRTLSTLKRIQDKHAVQSSDDRRLRPTSQPALDEIRLRQTIHDPADDRRLQSIARGASGDTRLRPRIHPTLYDTQVRPPAQTALDERRLLATVQAAYRPYNEEPMPRGADLTIASSFNPTRHVDQHSQSRARTRSSCSILVPSLKSSDSSLRRTVHRTMSSGGRSGTVVRFEEPFSTNEIWEMVSHEDDIATVESTDMDDSSESDEEAESNDGEEGTTSIEREITDMVSHSLSWRRGELKQGSVVDSNERSCMTLRHNNSASEQRLFDVIDRAFNSELGWGPLVALPSDNPVACPNSSEKDNHNKAPTLNDTTEARVTPLKLQCSFPLTERMRQEEDTRILHHTSSLGERRPRTGTQLEVYSSDGSRSCLGAGASRPHNPDHVAANDSYNKYKLFRRVGIASRIPRLGKSVIREHKPGCSSGIANECEQLQDRSWRQKQIPTADKWDEFVGDMLSLQPCVQ